MKNQKTVKKLTLEEFKKKSNGNDSKHFLEKIAGGILGTCHNVSYIQGPEGYCVTTYYNK